MDQGGDQGDYLAILASRIEVTQGDAKMMREKCAVVDKSISALISRIGTRPRETMDELKKEGERLEKIHVSTPQSNADERKFMMEMEKLRQRRKQVAEHQESQQAIDAFKLQRSEMQQQLREMMKILDELYSGSRKLKAASKSGANTADIVEESVTIPEDKMAHVIGRGGAGLRQLENDYSIHIDTERQGTCLRLTGTAEATARARSAIVAIASVCTEEFSVSQDKIACLYMDGTELVQELQRQHDVRIDVSRAKRVCKLVGRLENISAAKSAILTLPSSAETIAIEPAFLPFILGKNGATIRQIGEENHVSIDITREANTLEILGMQVNVAQAAAVVRGLIDTNREIEETLEIADKRIVLGCIMGPGGQKIRTLQKDLQVYLHTDKTTGEADAASVSKPTSLRIRGTRAHVFHAKEELQNMMRDYMLNTDTFTVPPDCLSSIVGKQGSCIKKMREDFPDVQVDLDGPTVCIHSECVASRLAVRLLIDNIVEANFVASVPFDADAMIVLKSTKGSELRTLLVDTLDLNMDLLAEDGIVRLRGHRSAVDQGTRALEGFQENHLCAILSCTEDDCNAFTHGGVENVLKRSVETRFGVEIYVSRKDCLVRIRGPRVAIENAKAFIQGTLRGDNNHDSLVIPANPALFFSLIGKGGSNMKKWEAEFPGVRIDLLKERGLIRILGPLDDAAIVKKMLLDAMDSIKVTSKVDLVAYSSAPQPVSLQNVDAVISLVGSMFQVQTEKGDDGKVLVLKGTFSLVEEAKTFILETVGGKAVRAIRVSVAHLSALLATTAALPPKQALFQAVRDEFGVDIGLDAGAAQVTVSGPTKATFEAKIRVISLLEAMFPCEFVSIAMSHSCLKQLGSPARLAEINMGAHIYADRPYSCIRIYGGAMEVNTTASCFRQKMLDWHEKRAEFPYQDHMLAALLGKGGANIASMQESMHVSLEINRQFRVIEVQASTKEDLLAASQFMTTYLDKLGGEYWETTVEGKNMGLLLGKKGVNIAKLREETGAKIDVNVNTNTVKVAGTAECVKIASEKIQSILQLVRHPSVQTLAIPAGAYAAILGPKGSTAQEIQETSGARLDLDRSTGIATVKGGEEACLKAIELITRLLLETGFGSADSVSTAPLSREDDGNDEQLVELVVAQDVQGPPMSQQSGSAVSLSKSSLRRRRRKVNGVVGKAEDDGGGYDEDEAPSGASPHVSVTEGQQVLAQAKNNEEASVSLSPPGLVRPHPLAATPQATPSLSEDAGRTGNAAEAYFKSKSGFTVRM